MASRTPRILRVNPAAALPPETLAEAGAILARGELVVVPTETVYGLAADPMTLHGVTALYRCKQRTADKPFAFLGARPQDFDPLGVTLSPMAVRLAEAFWPGPLTLVLPSRDGDIGVRIPDHPVIRSLLVHMGHPLAVTSANPTGVPPPVTADEAGETLGSGVALILDAGPSPGGVASTVLRVEGDDVEWLREGALKHAVVEKVLAMRARGGSPS